MIKKITREIIKFIGINMFILLMCGFFISWFAMAGISQGLEALKEYNEEALEDYHRYAESERIMDKYRNNE